MASLIRAALPPEILHELKHLALDLRKSVQELLVDAAIPTSSSSTGRQREQHYRC
jgi:hypothetical protein